MNEQRQEYTPAGIAMCITLKGEGTKGSGEVRVIVRLAEPFHGQGLKNIVESARKTDQLRECQQRRKTRL